MGGTCEVVVIPGRGHEVSPAFFECKELIDFVLKHAENKFIWVIQKNVPFRIYYIVRQVE